MGEFLLKWYNFFWNFCWNRLLAVHHDSIDFSSQISSPFCWVGHLKKSGVGNFTSDSATLVTTPAIKCLGLRVTCSRREARRSTPISQRLYIYCTSCSVTPTRSHHRFQRKVSRAVAHLLTATEQYNAQERAVAPKRQQRNRKPGWLKLRDGLHLLALCFEEISSHYWTHITFVLMDHKQTVIPFSDPLFHEDCLIKWRHRQHTKNRAKHGSKEVRRNVSWSIKQHAAKTSTIASRCSWRGGAFEQTREFLLSTRRRRNRL